MGGTLLASSEVGVGSVFHLTIPQVRHEQSSTGVDASTDPDLATESIPALVRDERPLTPAATAAWQHCATLAAGPWMLAWKALIAAPLFDDVEQFAQLLSTASGNETPEILRHYGQRLAEQARDFEVEEMTLSLREFPQLAAALQRGVALGSDTIILDVGL